tara:strand:+ start:43 stop:690 length:648 start_codon:yes stop_codon:yes gene_type:complete
MIHILELFSGTRSVGNAFGRKYKNCKVMSLDIDGKFNPTIQKDILKWNYKNCNFSHFDIIWASPPCTEYSIAKTIGSRKLDKADSIVKQTFKIIKHFKPTYWFIENPGGGGLLSKRPFMTKYRKYLNTCCYCKYGSKYKKPTCIWTNVENMCLKYCTKDTPCSFRKKYHFHEYTSQESRNPKNKHHFGKRIQFGSEARSVIPNKLIFTFMKHMNL